MICKSQWVIGQSLTSKRIFTNRSHTWLVYQSINILLDLVRFPCQTWRTLIEFGTSNNYPNDQLYLKFFGMHLAVIDGSMDTYVPIPVLRVACRMLETSFPYCTEWTHTHAVTCNMQPASAHPTIRWSVQMPWSNAGKHFRQMKESVGIRSGIVGIEISHHI